MHRPGHSRRRLRINSDPARQPQIGETWGSTMRTVSWSRGSTFATGVLSLVALALSSASNVRADDSLRCNQKLVTLGNSPYDVQSLCGPPDFTQHRVERRAVRNQVRGECAVGVSCSSSYFDSVEIAIDEWTYDFGSNRFVQYLVFESGKLIAVRSGDYGHKAPK